MRINFQFDFVAGFLLHHPALPFGEQVESVSAFAVETDDGFDKMMPAILRWYHQLLFGTKCNNQ